MPNTDLNTSTLIIIVTSLISFYSFSNRSLLSLFMFEPAKILRDKQYHRLLSCALIHGDLMHLLFNMFSFYSFGSLIEQKFGVNTLLAIYLYSILGGSILSLIFHRHEEDYRALGASGGVCGVIFASIFLTPGIKITIFPIPFPMPAWLFAILFVIVSYMGMKKQNSRIGHDAHLGGALSGLLLTTILYPSAITDNLWLFIVLVAISSIILLITVKPQQLLKLFSQSKHRKQQSGFEILDHSQKSPDDETILNNLLEKISQHGLASLTDSERNKLEELAHKNRSR